MTPANEASETAKDLVERELDGGRFEEWSVDDLAGQCRMQSRDNLDPDYSMFMAEVAKRLKRLQASLANVTDSQEARPDEASTAARFSRLHGICSRFRWEGGDCSLAVNDDATKLALAELAEFLFASGLAAAQKEGG